MPTGVGGSMPWTVPVASARLRRRLSGRGSQICSSDSQRLRRRSSATRASSLELAHITKPISLGASQYRDIYKSRHTKIPTWKRGRGATSDFAASRPSFVATRTSLERERERVSLRVSSPSRTLFERRLERRERRSRIYVRALFDRPFGHRHQLGIPLCQLCELSMISKALRKASGTELRSSRSSSLYL